MPRALLLLLPLLMTACQGAAPIYSPPPGGHDALSVPPAAVLPGQ